MVRRGGGPSHVRFVRPVGKPRRISTVRQRKKNPPDSRGLALVNLNEAGAGGQFGISDLPGRREFMPVWVETMRRSLSDAENSTLGRRGSITLSTPPHACSEETRGAMITMDLNEFQSSET